MSQFGFENNFEEGNFPDEDPAAEFLAREQDELAGLEDDNFAPSPIHVEVNGDFEDLENSEEIQMNGMSESEPTPPPKPIVREEPEKIKKWREEQKIRLEQKDEEEERKKDELREGAQHELDEWYRHHMEQVEKTQLQNRNAEKEHVMERDAQTTGQEWEKIARLCDFNPKTSKTSKDVSRMRSIILQLKQSPPAKKQ
uniref:Clathrin light chain n=1 Tax=Strigamia maritima TaxID=126957 RepID=T1JKJ1_STRMM